MKRLDICTSNPQRLAFPDDRRGLMCREGDMVTPDAAENNNAIDSEAVKKSCETLSKIAIEIL